MDTPKQDIKVVPVRGVTDDTSPVYEPSIPPDDVSPLYKPSIPPMPDVGGHENKEYSPEEPVFSLTPDSDEALITTLEHKHTLLQQQADNTKKELDVLIARRLLLSFIKEIREDSKLIIAFDDEDASRYADNIPKQEWESLDLVYATTGKSAEFEYQYIRERTSKYSLDSGYHEWHEGGTHAHSDEKRCNDDTEESDNSCDEKLDSPSKSIPRISRIYRNYSGLVLNGRGLSTDNKPERWKVRTVVEIDDDAQPEEEWECGSWEIGRFRKTVYIVANRKVWDVVKREYQKKSKPKPRPKKKRRCGKE